MPPQELVEDDEEDIDEAELNLDKVEEEMAADYSDEEEDEIMHIDEFCISPKILPMAGLGRVRRVVMVFRFNESACR